MLTNEQKREILELAGYEFGSCNEVDKLGLRFGCKTPNAEKAWKQFISYGPFKWTHLYSELEHAIETAWTYYNANN